MPPRSLRHCGAFLSVCLFICHNSGVLGDEVTLVESWIEVAAIVVVLVVPIRFFMKRS